MKITCYPKILLLAFSLLISSVSAMEHASNLKHLFLTNEAATILATASIVGVYSGLTQTLLRIGTNYSSYSKKKENFNNEKSLGIKNSKKIEEPSFTALTLDDLKEITKEFIVPSILKGVPLGVLRVFSERYGSWAQASSTKPFLISLGCTSALVLFKSCLEGRGCSLNWKVYMSASEMTYWFSHVVLGASAWTVLNRYRMS